MQVGWIILVLAGVLSACGQEATPRIEGSSPSPASAPAPPPALPAAPTWKGQEDFLTTAAVLSQGHVELAMLARERSGGVAVQEFTAATIERHSAILRALSAAAPHGLAVPAQVPPGSTMATTKAQLGLHSEFFDRAYAFVAASTHAETLSLYRQAREREPPGRVRDFVEATIPLLEEQWSGARRLQAGVRSRRKPNGSAAPGGAGNQ